ncbi:MAG: FeoB-associated Cys-rich membrane protein [Clostridia bacterium]
MQPIEIIVIIACSAIVVGVIISAIIRKKHGKSSCDCGSNCANCQYHCDHKK